MKKVLFKKARRPGLKHFIQVKPYAVNVTLGEIVELKDQAAYDLVGKYADMFEIVESQPKQRAKAKTKDVKQVSHEKVLRDL